MNNTNLEHLWVALTIQLIIGVITGNFWIGAAFVMGIFSGREHAQREYKIGDPSKLHGYEALDFWRWKRDAQFDLLFPVVGSIIFALIMTL